MSLASFTSVSSRRAAFARQQYPRLAALAQQNVSEHPQAILPWLDLAVALYNVRRYSQAMEAVSAALLLAPSPQIRAKLDLFLRCARLIVRVQQRERSSSGVTECLQADWYAKRLQELAENGELRAFPSLEQLKSKVAHLYDGFSDCVLTVCTPERLNSGWTEAYTLDGGLRSVGADLLHGFPRDQLTGGYLYHKKGVDSLTCGRCTDGQACCRYCLEEEFPLPAFEFPRFGAFLPEGVEERGGQHLGVLVGHRLVSKRMQAILSEELGKLGTRRPDSPVPKYHNIIDPNIAAVDGKWIPTEFEIKELSAAEALRPVKHAISRASGGSGGADELIELVHERTGSRYARSAIASTIPDLDPHKHASLYVAIEHVLDAAVPLLAHLRLPALLLPGPLQAVVKAQRIVLEDGDTYEGVWHEDGLREHVVAVVLYYYGVSSSLQGGAMEFASKKKSMMYTGDGDGYEYDTDGARKALRDLTRCITPIGEGSMLVFSNYAAVHRVLRMVAAGSGGSRDFLALFIIDQRVPLARPVTFGSRKERIKRRAGMLREQLQTRGHFGMFDGVCCVGNGRLSDLAWITQGQVFPVETDIADSDDDGCAQGFVSRLNMMPPVMGRGSSFLTEMTLPPAQFNPASRFLLHVVQSSAKDLHLFVDPGRLSYASEIPESGIRAIELFDTAHEWMQQGFQTADASLRNHVLSVLEAQISSKPGPLVK